MSQSLSLDIKRAVRVACLNSNLELRIEDISLEHPAVEEHGDYSTNIALKVSNRIGKKSHDLAEQLVRELKKIPNPPWERVEVAGAGFVNFSLSPQVFLQEVYQISNKANIYGQGDSLTEKKIMVEYAHPNTHKELHIGHMRTLITGEALVRIFAASAAKVFRANYQGDIGPHVAKAIWGTEKLLEERKMTWVQAEKLGLSAKAHLLGEGYVRGNQDYMSNQKEIDTLNIKIYRQDKDVKQIYERTRRWSLEYYDMFYKRFGTKFDKLYFESQTGGPGKKIVLDHVGKVFEESDKAIIFDGERYGLHKRVFVTSEGNPTYEAKDIGLAPMQFVDFPFDFCVHVVASEQSDYFQVVFKALELVDSKFTDRQYHLPMGMVNLVGRKMSSRTGVILTVDGLLGEVKDLVKQLIQTRDLARFERKEILEKVTLAAVKYSVLKVGPTLDVDFDLEKSVSLEGDSGPYLQYTYARARSVIRKSNIKDQISKIQVEDQKLEPEEIAILRYLYRFPEVVESAARTYSPNLICSYLFELAKRFNNFYNNIPILQAGIKSQVDFRLALTQATSIVLKNGLNLLGIETLERM